MSTTISSEDQFTNITETHQSWLKSIDFKDRILHPVFHGREAGLTLTLARWHVVIHSANLHKLFFRDWHCQCLLFITSKITSNSQAN